MNYFELEFHLKQITNIELRNNTRALIHNIENMKNNKLQDTLEKYRYLHKHEKKEEYRLAYNLVLTFLEAEILKRS